MTQILGYHALAGNFNVTTILKTVKENGARAQLVTLQGGRLTFWIKGKDLYVREAKG